MNTGLTHFCPHCKYEMTHIADAFGDKERPDDGDFSLCVRCGEWAVFENDMPRLPTVDEYIEIGRNETCDKAKLAWLYVIKQGGRRYT